MYHSAQRELYMELDRKIELMTKALYFCSNYLSVVGALASGLIIGYTNYYVSDMKDESFALPLLVA